MDAKIKEKKIELCCDFLFRVKTKNYLKEE